MDKQKAVSDKQSAWDKAAKYDYSEESTVHNPLELDDEGRVHTWTLELNGDSFRVTREVWEAYNAQLAAASSEQSVK